MKTNRNSVHELTRNIREHKKPTRNSYFLIPKKQYENFEKPKKVLGRISKFQGHLTNIV